MNMGTSLHQIYKNRLGQIFCLAHQTTKANPQWKKNRNLCSVFCEIAELIR